MSKRVRLQIAGVQAEIHYDLKGVQTVKSLNLPVCVMCVQTVKSLDLPVCVMCTI